jgi:endonuclease/exonuclease/phosphatase family metal-dependent hydrolase
MITTALVAVLYLVILLELLFKDDLIIVRYLHFGYLSIFLLSTFLMLYFLVRSIFSNKKSLIKLLILLPAFIFITIKYFTPFFLHHQPLTEATNNSSSFTFLSFSVNHRNKKYEEVTQLLKQNPADIICLQEIPYSRYQLFWSSMKTAGVNQYQHVYSRKKSLMILSKQAITPNKTMPYLQATTKLDGHILKIWNLHSPKSLKKKNYQDFYFTKLLQDIVADSSKYQLVCGDFNSTPHNDIVINLEEAAQLQAAYRYSKETINFSYPTVNGIIPSPLPLIKIDYLLFTSSFNIKDYQRIKEYAYSDHYPIKAVTQFQDNL